jgi:hypothetical protein
MNAKAKSRRNKHRSMALLEAAGYRCTRSAGSLGEWDIIGIGRGVVPSEDGDWPSAAEWEVLRLFPAPPRQVEAPPNCR